MTWAGQRQLIVFSILGAIVVAFIAIIGIATFYKSPTCTDGAKNQDEQGVDCGGSCAYLCTAGQEPPTVLFTKAIPSGVGRLDVVALVENKNATAAAKDVPYTITVYGFGQSLIQRVSGTLDLPPAGSVPVFVPGIVSGKQAVETSFLSIDGSAVKWYALPGDPRLLPSVSDIVLAGSTGSPRVTATLSNSDVAPMSNVRIVAIIRDASGNAVGASQTLIRTIPALGRATATFTWNAPFEGVPVSIQVFPIIPLP
ncbi:MAG: hypothetical protein Q7S95_04335 [bacterium]|nr:hypothetical protein [bacterium]